MADYQVLQILDDPAQFFYIDPAAPAFAWLSPRLVERDVAAVYWVWEGAFSFADHAPVLGIAARAVKAAIPGAGPWPIWGDFPGAGDTDVDRKADSIRQAREHSAWLGVKLTDAESPNTPRQQQGRSTLDAVIEATAGALQGGPGDAC
jgi:hypothetical protein